MSNWLSNPELSQRITPSWVRTGVSPERSSMSASSSASTYPIMAAILSANGYLGQDYRWCHQNDLQETFLKSFHESKHEVSRLSELISSIASQDASAINSFLQARGFSIQLQPFAGPRSFGVASVLDVLVKWMKPGKEKSIERGGVQYPAVKLENVSVVSSSKHEHPIVRLVTQPRWVGEEIMVFMTPYSGRLGNQFEMMSAANKLSTCLSPVNEFNSVIFPMVNMNQKVDIGWIVGLSTEDDRFCVEQALQQNKLRINQFGARAQSAVAMEMRSMSFERGEFTIDQPFLVWFVKDGCSQPLFAAHVCESDWKDPGDLSVA